MKNYRILIALTIVLNFFLSSAAARFAFLSDMHVSPHTPNDSALRLAVKEINGLNLDAVIVGGDISNEGSDEQIRNVAEILKDLKHPLYIIPGNHENNWSQSATKTFNDIFGNDRFIFRVDSLIVVGINCGPYMKMGDGHIKQEDLHWLNSELKKQLRPGDKVLSINHYPVRENDLDNYIEYAAVLSKFPVIGHINGHYHSWIGYDIEDLPGVMVRSLDMRKNNFGYTLIDVQGDWTHIYDKQIGAKPIAKYAFANATNHPALKKRIACSEAINVVSPEGFEITKLWADSASVFTRVSLDDRNIYFGTSEGEAKSISKKDGDLNWSISVPDSASLFASMSPLANRILSIPYSSGILFVDAETGKTKRVESTPGFPYVADGIVSGDEYFQGGYGKFELRKRNGGKIRNSYTDINNYCQGRPAVNEDVVIFGAWDTNLRALDRKTGKLLWKWNNGKSANMYSPGNVVPVIANGRVYIVAPDRFMTALDLKTGKELWRDNSHRYRESLGVSEDGKRVYSKTMDGELVAVSTETPEFQEDWICDMGLGYDHAPCPILEKDGVIYSGSRNGRVVAVDADKHQVLWTAKLGSSEVNGFEADPETGDIYLSLIEGTIYKISSKK